MTCNHKVLRSNSAKIGPQWVLYFIFLAFKLGVGVNLNCRVPCTFHPHKTWILYLIWNQKFCVITGEHFLSKYSLHDYVCKQIGIWSLNSEKKQPFFSRRMYSILLILKIYAMSSETQQKTPWKYLFYQQVNAFT